MEHDYTARTRGHDFGIKEVRRGGARLSAYGWGEGIKVFDHLILPNGKATTRYRVDAIRYMRDPRDMWFAELSFAPRSEVAGALDAVAPPEGGE